MKTRLFLICFGLLMAAGCDDEVGELKAINAEQRQHVQQLLGAHRATVDELNIQLERNAQKKTEDDTKNASHGFLGITSLVLGCALAVSLTIAFGRRGARDGSQRS